MIENRAILFRGENNERMFGVLSPGESGRKRAVVVVVGGPQYRVGSHRQFVHLARALSRCGTPVLRFDCRGMGDSEGDFDSFENIASDIDAAMWALEKELPEIDQIVLWGLCDGATAAALYSVSNPRVCGMVLVNPWVRGEDSRAETLVTYHYLRRLRSREFWSRVVVGDVEIRKSIIGFLRSSKAYFSSIVSRVFGLSIHRNTGESSTAEFEGRSLADRLLDSVAAFDGHLLFLLSGKDLTAAEFNQEMSKRRGWKTVLRDSTVQLVSIPEADHTFSSHKFRSVSEEATRDWLESW